MVHVKCLQVVCHFRKIYLLYCGSSARFERKFYFMASLADKQAVSAKVLIAKIGDEGISAIVNLSSKNPDLNDKSKIVKINFKKYDEDSRTWVNPDEETTKAAKERVEAFGVDWHNGDIKAIAHDLQGKSADMFATEDRIQFTPIQEFVRFSQLNRQDSQILKKLDAVPLKTVSEWNGHRFNFGFAFADADGKEKNARLSQIIVVNPDDPNDANYVSVKYENKEINSYRQDLDDGKISKDMQGAVKTALDDLLKNSREEKLAELDDSIFGEGGLEKLLDGGDPNKYVVTDFDPQSFDSQDGVRYYVAAVIRPRTADDNID